MTTVLADLRRKTRVVRRRIRHKVLDIDSRYPTLGRWTQYVVIAALVLVTIGLVIYALQAAGGR